MGLKVDSSFLKYVTMGAAGTGRVAELMVQSGLQPIELERYSRSNKIWVTKVKRLRLPDLLCVKTGQRVEVRAKSKLAIRMSDAPDNPQRRWNSGLRDGDLIAFMHVREENDTIIPAANAELFRVEELRISEPQSKLGPPKSASEGAERDREWPSIVASDAGEVIEATESKIRVRLHSNRTQTYQLKGKSLYLNVGDRFCGTTEFLAGIPKRKATFPGPKTKGWDPRTLLGSDSLIDRYVAVKALGVVGSPTDFPVLTRIVQCDTEPRVALEAAASLARLGNERGLDQLRKIIAEPAVGYLRMEAVLAISELRETPLDSVCAEILAECAFSKSLAGDEVRQAAIWGLGKDGLADYGKLLPSLASESDEERVHTVCAFAGEVPQGVLDSLIAILTSSHTSNCARAAASYVLSQKLSPTLAVSALIRVLNQSAKDCDKNWIIATLGQVDAERVGGNDVDSQTLDRLKLLQLISPRTNWTHSERLVAMLSFVNKQTVFN